MNNDLKKILRDLRRKNTDKSNLGIQLNIGDDGLMKMKGQDGYTPVKGIDYWTPEEVEEMVTAIFNAAKPKKGADYYTELEKRAFVAEVLKLATPVKGRDYRDGKDGKDGRDGKDAEEVDARKVAIDAINFLESFEGDARLSAKALKDLDEAVTEILRKGADFELSEKQITTIKDLLPKYPPINAGGSGATFLKSLRDVDLSGLTKNADGKYILGGGSGSSTFLDLTDTPSSYSGQAGKFAKVNAGEDGLEFVTITGGGNMLSTNNLSDVADVATSRTNLGLGSAAVADSTDFAPALGTDDNYVTDAEKAALHSHSNKSVLDATTASFTTADETKLDGIEAGADVTDAANVDAAGAVMNSDTSTAAMSFVIDEDDMSSDSATKVPTQQSVKAYVDAVAQGLKVKDSVRVATAAPLPANTYNNGASGVGATLTGVATGVLTVDGVTVALNDRILVKDEVTGANNGIYVCTVAGALGVAYVLTRSTNFDAGTEISGAFTFVEEGTTNADAGFVCTTNDPIAVGTTALSFTQFSGAGQITAGNALTKTGNTLDVAVDNSTIEVSSDALRVKDGGITNAKIADGTIDEAKLDTSVNASLDLADSAVQDLSDLSITATATELNYTDGVTSNIQTQLDAKAPKASPTFTGTTTSDLFVYDAARGKVTAGGNLGAAETINFNDETNYTGTLDSNITFTFANATSGDEVTLFLSYDGSAQRAITWPTVTWLDNATGAAPATPSASGKVLVVTVRYIGTTYYASATGNYAVYS